ncbi:hypothetical protein F511_30864 [Dorcoceras hygrometricum]|uniref:Uncharacterized protein n=1 Tax=Dorcoceras hygrometricum TaxID=472368 RepID=A0A2Z7BTB5_9LAMI|nr:hypothetical protein F511_30864 [Dorcoceras hygrometricum]
MAATDRTHYSTDRPSWYFKELGREITPETTRVSSSSGIYTTNYGHPELKTTIAYHKLFPPEEFSSGKLTRNMT